MNLDYTVTSPYLSDGIKRKIEYLPDSSDKNWFAPFNFDFDEKTYLHSSDNSGNVLVLFTMSVPEEGVTSKAYETALKERNIVTVCVPTKSQVVNYPFAIAFIKELLALQDNRVEDALDIVFQKIDEKLSYKDVEDIESFLSQVSIGSLRPEILVGILTITLPWANKLVNRKQFFEKVEEHLLFVFGNQNKVSRILAGLRT